MAILLKDEIELLAKNKDVNLLGNDFLQENLQPCSYDLRIGTVFKDGKIFSNESDQDANWNIEIKPSEIITMLTLEEVSIPVNIAATVFAINKWSSTGFLILNPGHIDPGFKGPISICAINLSKSTIRLYRGMKIFTILFDDLGKYAESYKNKVYENRKAREQKFYRDNASKLSKSLFDLILEDEYTPYLKDIIKKSISERVYVYLKWFVGGIVTIATIFGGISYFMPPKNYEKEMIDSKKKCDSLQNAVINLKKEIIEKEDSIKFIYKK